jgi:hypothetical protein
MLNLRMQLVMVVAVGLALPSAGCSPRSAGRVSLSPPAASVRASNGLVLSLETSGADLPSGRSEVARVVFENSSETSVSFAATLLIRILDSKGHAVYDSTPPLTRHPHPPIATRLAPGQKVIRPFTFVVPPPGSYTMEAALFWNRLFVQPASLRFVSTRAHK